MLRHVTSTLTIWTLVSAMSLFAQGPPAQPERPQAQTPPAATETVTGCVVAAKTTDGGTAYVLNEAEGGSAKLYVLAEGPKTGAPQPDWSTNVNKKVEVTGPVQQPPAPPVEEGAAGNQKVLRPPMVRVESSKVVAENCK
jgi:hypothetical protein